MQIVIHPSSALWTLYCSGALIGESHQALELREGDHPPVLYFPRSDIAMDLLERSSLTTLCPYKGVASYFHIVTPAARVENAVWSYETPKQPMGAIAGALAFQPDRVILKAAADAPEKVAP
jgi:uncharacterized protein (DUF427 family)